MTATAATGGYLPMMSTMLCDHRRKCFRTACRSCEAAGHGPHPTAARRCNCIGRKSPLARISFSKFNYSDGP